MVLSKFSLKDIISGARVEVADYKNPEDFVLWKPSKKMNLIGIAHGVMVDLDGT